MIRDKIIIVEDDPGISKFLRTTLTTNHYEALWTDTGVKALEMISSHCPDCILLDLGLPDLDGTEIILLGQNAHHRDLCPQHGGG